MHLTRMFCIRSFFPINLVFPNLDLFCCWGHIEHTLSFNRCQGGDKKVNKLWLYASGFDSVQFDTHHKQRPSRVRHQSKNEPPSQCAHTIKSMYVYIWVISVGVWIWVDWSERGIVSWLGKTAKLLFIFTFLFLFFWTYYIRRSAGKCHVTSVMVTASHYMMTHGKIGHMISVGK